MNIAMLGGVAILAEIATMHWLHTMWPYAFQCEFFDIYKFILGPGMMANYFMELAVATAITGAVVAAGVLAGTLGKSGPTTPTGAAVNAARRNSIDSLEPDLAQRGGGDHDGGVNDRVDELYPISDKFVSAVFSSDGPAGAGVSGRHRTSERCGPTDFRG